MKFPRLLRVGNLFLYTAFFGCGVVVSGMYPRVPKEVMHWIGKVYPQKKADTEVTPRIEPIRPRKPTLKEINEVLSDSKALVEAQHSFYVHVMHNERFAANVKEMGSLSEKGGVVMVQSAYDASDAVEEPHAVHGYLFKSVPVAMGPGKKDGFAVLAYPDGEEKWPVYLTIVADAKGGIIAMAAAETWEVEDEAAAKDMRAQFGHGKVKMEDLAKYSPDGPLDKSYRITGFTKVIEHAK